MPGFAKIGAGIRALTRGQLSLGQLIRWGKGKAPASLGEGLKRVKYTMKGVGNDLANTPGERAYKTTDGTAMRFSLFNIKLNAQAGTLGKNAIHNRQVGNGLRVLRSKRQPLEDGVYGFTRLRYLSQTPASKHKIQYTMAHKSGISSFAWPSIEGYTMKKEVSYPATKAEVKALTAKPAKTHENLPVVGMTRSVQNYQNGEKHYPTYFKFGEHREPIKGW